MTALLEKTHDASLAPPEGVCTACGWQPEPDALWPSVGGVAVRWIEDNLIFAEGDWFGKPFKLRPDQQEFLWRWYETCGKCGVWHYDEALRGAATGDGKTAFTAAIACLEFAGPPQIAPTSPNIPIAAASFEQADLLFGAVSVMLGGRERQVHEAPLHGFFDVYDTEIKFNDGRPGRMYRIAARAGTNEGGLPHLFIADELHEWNDVGDTRGRVHVVISKSTRKRRTSRGSGRVLNISTAGFDVDHSLLGAMYKLGKRAQHDRTLAPRLLFDWHEAPDGLDYEDPKQREIAVRAASPGAGVQFSIADRVNDWNKPTFEHHEWIRYFANRWVDVAEESWLVDHPSAWADCQGEWDHDQANPFVIGVDMALKRDSVAVVRCERVPDQRTAVTARIWRADDHDGRIPHKDVWRYIKAEAVGAGFRGVAYDPRYFQLAAENLEDEGIEVIEFDQQPQRMAPACGHAFQQIVDKQIVHDGDPDLTGHVLAAVKRQQERGFTLAKGKSKRHIDAAVAMCMALWVLEQADEAIEPFVGSY
jgi:phage terminase large subunit-like protein